MTINSVKSVNFGEQEKRKSGSLTLPILGTAAGGLITGFTRLGQKDLILDSNLKSDVFAKATSKLKDETDIANAKTFETYLKEQEASASTSASTDTATTTNAADEVAKELKEKGKYFEDLKAEHQHVQEIHKVEAEHTQQIQKLYDEVFGAKTSDAVMLKDEEKAQHEAQKADCQRQLKQIETQLKDEKVSEAQKKVLSEQKTVLDKKVEEIDTKIFSPAQLEEKRVADLAKPLEDAVNKATEEATKVTGAYLEKGKALDAKKAEVTKADAELKAANAAKKEESEIKKLEEALNKLKSEQATLETEKLSLEHQAEIAKIKYDFVTAKQNCLKKATAAERKAALEALYIQQTGKISLDGKTGSVIEMEKALLAKAKTCHEYLTELKEDSGKITKAQEEFAKMMGIATESTKAGESAPKAVKEMPENVTKAMEALKGKITKVGGWRIVGGAAIGLGIGYILKWIFGGKSEE